MINLFYKIISNKIIIKIIIYVVLPKITNKLHTHFF